MEFVRMIINSDILEKVIKIPASLRKQKVEILILPVNEDIAVKQKTEFQSLRGALKSYSNPDSIKLESSVWRKAMVEKHGNS